MQSEETTKTAPDAGQTKEGESAARPRIRLEFAKDGLIIRNNTVPTIVMGGILTQAAAMKPEPMTNEEDAQVVEIDYDYATDKCVVRSNASPVFYRGMFYMAQMMMIQMQLIGTFGKAAAGVAGQPQRRIPRPGIA
jgi:hypothetical protein